MNLKPLHALLHIAQGWAHTNDLRNTFWSAALPQLSLPCPELRARAPLKALKCEERPCTLTSSDTFLENDLISRGQSKFQSVVHRAPCHLLIWWKRKQKLVADVSPSSCATLVKSSALSSPLSSKDLPPSIGTALSRGLPASALQTSCAMDMRMCLHQESMGGTRGTSLDVCLLPC